MATSGLGAVESGFSVKPTPELTVIGQLTDEVPSTSANGIAAEVAQTDSSGRALLFLDEIANRDAEMATAVDDELRQVELLLEESNHALKLRTLALSAAEELLAKKLKI